MKKLLLLIFLTIFLSSCSKPISPQDVSKISFGMSSDKVVEILGRPTLKTTDRSELSGKYDGLTMLYITKIELDENEDNKTRGYDEYSDIYSAINDKENVELFTYETNKNNHDIYIYFLNDKVSFFYDYDLNE